MASQARYRLLVDDDGCVLRTDYRKYGFYVSLIPLSAFVFCIVYSVVNHFESSTATQCRAYNVLPSISAAIGGFSPQKEVWKAAILIDAPPRFLIVYLYGIYHLQVLSKKAGILILISGALNLIENVALISLTLFDSTNNYPMHEKSFITFIITSELYMLMIICMQSYRVQSRNWAEAYGLKLKKLLVIVNITGILFAAYFFIVHNMDCPDFAYTKFAICEYIVVFSNILYHFTSIYDFHDKQLVFHKCSIHLR